MVASGGGHLIQLCRLVRLMGEATARATVVVTAGELSARSPNFAVVEPCRDFNRDNVWRAGQTFAQMWRLIGRHRPQALVTTGAAPGLIAVACGRARGVRCLWIDSLANTRRLSLSGRMARYLGATVVSQWPAVARRHGVHYYGSLL